MTVVHDEHARPARTVTRPLAAPRVIGRGRVDSLVSPHPLGAFLPALYQDDGFTQRLLAALDETLAPVFSTLDNLEVYFDPAVAPPDFVTWLAGWIGLTVDGWPLERRRALLAHAVDLYRKRGTVVGLKEQIEVMTGAPVEIIDSGGAAYSQNAGTALPGSAEFSLRVRVRVPPQHNGDPQRIATEQLYELVGALKPAHLVHLVEVVSS